MKEFRFYIVYDMGLVRLELVLISYLYRHF